MAACIVIIPTYNEIENVEAKIRADYELPKEFHDLIVEDKSPDGKEACVAKLQKEYPEIHYL